MGSVYHGVPRDLALRLRDAHELTWFIETGTGGGATARWASKNFAHVATIELHENYYEATKWLSANVRRILGDSRVELPKVLELVDGRALVWLDAHWSCDLHYTRPAAGENPLREELKAVKDTGHVLMIDDARYFVRGVPPPHEADQWPTFDDIVLILKDWNLEIESDVIVAVRK